MQDPTTTTTTFELVEIPDDLFEPQPQPGDGLFVAVFLVGFVCLCIAIIAGWRRLLRRRPSMVVGSPSPSSTAPPGDLATAAFVASNATKVDERSLAAVVLALADRGALRLHLLPGGGIDADLSGGYHPRTRAERQVLDLLKRQPAGPRSRLWSDLPSGWWARFRRSILLDAYDAGLVKHAIGIPPAPEPLALPSVVWVMAGTLIGGTLAATVAVDVIPFEWTAYPMLALILGVCIRLFPWELTESGEHLARNWEAHRRWLASYGDFADVPAAGVTIWGEHLAHATVVGLAPAAVADLRPLVARHTGRYRRS